MNPFLSWLPRAFHELSTTAGKFAWMVFVVPLCYVFTPEKCTSLFSTFIRKKWKIAKEKYRLYLDYCEKALKFCFSFKQQKISLKFNV